jgi:hypothetical protein
MFKARVYFYLHSLAEARVGHAATGRRTPASARDSVIGLSESEIIDFIHDPRHHWAVIRTAEQTEECARKALEAAHPNRMVVLKSVTWLC